jgi:RND superfamily putative drug exporter
VLISLASFCYRRRWIVLAAWIALMVGISALSSSAGTAWSQSFNLAGSDSQIATDLLKSKFPSEGSLMTGQVVFKADRGVADPAVASKLSGIFTDLASLPGVASVISPYDEGGRGPLQISPDGTVAFAEISFSAENAKEVPQSTVDAISTAAKDANGDGLQVETFGHLFSQQAPPGTTEAIGLLAAVVILLIAFGSVLAMGLPILTALFGIGVGFGVVTLLAHVTSVPEFSTQLAAMIGIGVGIDYALFIVTRYRQGLHEGFEPKLAVEVAIDTAGRAVLFAGTTVVISLGGMLLMGVEFVAGLGVAAASVVAITMLASVTLLPAILGFVGTNIDKLRVPGLGKNAHGSRQTVWFRWSRSLQKHPWPAAIGGFLVLLILATPVLSMRLGSSDEGNLPTTDTVRRAYDLKAEGFGPGANGPFILVATLPADGTGPATMAKLAEALQADVDVALAAPLPPSEAGDAARLFVIPKSSAQDQATQDLLHRIRNDIVPTTTAGTGVSVHVGGITAVFEDLAEKLQERLPVFIGVVLGLSFLLLMVVFRSILVPIKAVIMNLLSIGAAYGIVVAVFQWGWGASLFGVGKGGPIESFLPMMMFAILFGLSMDYEVFLLSRIKEEYDRTGDNSLAVADGLSATARVITAAAAIMIMVFGSFIFGDNRVVKMFGLGLSVAVFIDATIVRLLLVPATMELLGSTNWWFPKWLQWLPEIHVEGSAVPIGDVASGVGEELDDELAALTATDELERS